MDPFSSKFDILDPVSIGHDSDVFLIKKKDSDEYFLLKSLKENISTGKDAINRKIRFRREIDIVSAFDHPGIARPIGTFVDDKTYSIIYPYRKGRTLAKTLEQGILFSESDAVHIIFQVLDALGYIHARGIIHADVNPHNVFMDDAKGVELLDFGVSMTEEEARKLPEDRIIGTLPFLAPEQMGFTDFKIDTRTDLYCAALMLFRLVSGSLPFGNHIGKNSISDLLDATLKRELPPIKKINATLNMVLLKALKPSPEDRYQTAEGFKADLRYAFRELEGHSDGLFILGEKDAIASVNRSKLFVARENEITILEKGFDRLLRREFSSFLIYARSGIGKTEIVRQFSARITESNCFFLPSKCNLFTPHQPYSIFRHIVCEFIARSNRESEKNREEFKIAINKQLAEYSGVICQTIPEMKDFFQEVRVVDKVEPEKEADRIAHVLATLLLTLCDIRPLIIFIDDLQWIDHVTFEICKKVMREKPPCMLVYNYRTGEIETDLYVFGNDLHDIGIDRLIHIQPFTREETKNLLSSRFNEVKNSEALVEMLFSKTDGNPFVVTEAIRYLVNTGYLVRENCGWTYKLAQTKLLPEKFDPVSLILGKEDQLSQDERHCLGLLSLIQGKFDNSLIEKFVNINQTQAKICLHRFENLGFIIAHFKGGYSFSHDRVQESIAEGINPDEKGVQYERLAGIYEEMIPDKKESVYNAAECYLKTKNPVKAIEVSFKAATFAAEQVAFDVAIRYFKSTQFLLKQCAKNNIATPVEPIKVEMAFGDVLMLTGKNEQVLKMFQALLDDKNRLDQNQILEVKYKIGSIYHHLGEFENSIPYFREALLVLGISYSNNRIVIILSLLFEIVKEIILSFGIANLLLKKSNSESLLISKILNKLAYSLYFSDMITSVYLQFKSHNFAERIIDSFEKAEAFGMHGVALYQMMQKKIALKIQKKALEISNKIHRKDSIAFSKSVSSLVFYYYAHWSQSEEAARSSIELFKSLGNISDQILSAEHLWKNQLIQGNFVSGLKSMELTIDLCTRVNEKYFLLVTRAAKHLTQQIINGDPDKNEYFEIDNLLQKMKSFLFHIETGSYLVNVDILNNNLESAYNRLLKLTPLIWKKCINSEYQVRTFSLFCDVIILEIINRRKNVHVLHQSLSNLQTQFRFNFLVLRFSCLSYPAYWGSYYRSQAWWHALKNRKKKAHKYFKKAIKAHHSLDMRYEEARSIRDYANFLEDFCNLPGEARDKYTEAYKLFDWCGAKLETDRIKDKVDLACLQIKGAIDIQREETTFNPVTSFTTAAGVNQLRVNTLYDLSNSIQNIDDINELLHKILGSMIAATGAQFGGLFVGGEENHQQRPLFMDFEGKTLLEDSVSFSQAIVDKVRDKQEIILVKDGVRSGEITDGPNKDVRSALCVPLTRGKSLHGCVYLGNNMVAGLFSDDSKKTALIIAAEASILLENAFLMDSYKSLNRDLQKKVREQTADIREKNKQLAENNLKIVDSERMKTLLGGTIVHDIKNYAAGIEGNATLLARQFPEEQKILKTVRIVTDCCTGIVSLASNMLDIGKMEDGKLVLKKELLTKSVLFEMATQISGKVMFEEKSISLSFLDNTKGMFAIDADYYLVERVMQNMFSNAAKYVPRNGTVVVSLEIADNEHVLCFFHSGRPIPDEDKTTLFDKYARVESKESQYSKGLGLFFCKMVMSAHHGRIWVDPDPKGNYFKLAFKKSIALSLVSPAA
jgi:serine/threonine protein kinase/signal transduction histidine kinase/tetratricopeptide (TPR) repeat protein